MLAAGAELGHSQQGNNNPYCQDNETTWIDWSCADESMIGFTSRLLRLRRAYLPFGNFRYEGTAAAAGVPDIAWFSAEGSPLDAAAWQSTDRALGVWIGRPGRTAAANAVLLLFNGADSARMFRLPAGTWRAVFDSDEASGVPRCARAEGDASAAAAPIEGDRRVAAMSVQWLVAEAAAAALVGAAA
jgi:glycogen operon protein